MAKKQITVQITSGTPVGTFSVYKTSILSDNLLETSISLASLQSGKTYRVDRSVTQVLLVNDNNDCKTVKILSV